MYIFYFIFKLPSLHRCVIFWIPLTKQRMVHVLEMIFLKCLICRSWTFYQVKNRKKKYYENFPLIDPVSEMHDHFNYCFLSTCACEHVNVYAAYIIPNYTCTYLKMFILL